MTPLRKQHHVGAPNFPAKRLRGNGWIQVPRKHLEGDYGLWTQTQLGLLCWQQRGQDRDPCCVGEVSDNVWGDSEGQCRWRGHSKCLYTFWPNVIINRVRQLDLNGVYQNELHMKPRNITIWTYLTAIWVLKGLQPNVLEKQLYTLTDFSVYQAGAFNRISYFFKKLFTPLHWCVTLSFKYIDDKNTMHW